MPIFFGWGRQTKKQIGITFKNLCNHCHNEEFWILTRVMTWFTLFFIPVFPYSIKYFLSCPVCKYGLVLNQKLLEQIRPIAEVNQLLVDGKISQAEHQARIAQLGNGTPTVTEHTQREVLETKAAIEQNSVQTNYCIECGKKITKEIKFCGNCGTQVASR